MKAKKMNLIDACDKACVIVVQAREMDKLYRKGVQCLGEGQAAKRRHEPCDRSDCDEKLKEEVFVSDENVVSFVWRLDSIFVGGSGRLKERQTEKPRQ